MSIRSQLAKAAVVLVLGALALTPVQAEEPEEEENGCSGEVVYSAYDIDHCCNRFECSFWRDPKFNSKFYRYADGCISIDYHFGQDGCCSIFDPPDN